MKQIQIYNLFINVTFIFTPPCEIKDTTHKNYLKNKGKNMATQILKKPLKTIM